QAARQVVGEMGRARRLLGAAGASATRTVQALGSLITGDDSNRLANRAIEEAIIQQDPVAGRIASFAGGAADPAFLAAFGVTAPAVRALGGAIGATAAGRGLAGVASRLPAALRGPAARAIAADVA